MSIRSEEAPLLLQTARGPLDASVRVPGSKSISNRALVCAALAVGETRLTNVAPGDDTAAMLDSLNRLGIRCDIDGSSVLVAGVAGAVVGGGTLDARLAGTTSRFLTAVCCVAERPTTIIGDAPLRRRPMGDLHDALTSLGANIRYLESPGHLPIEVSRGRLVGGTISLRGDVSSQFLTALMLIGPYLEGGLDVHLTSTLVSRPYVDMTARVMAAFGVVGVAVDGDRVLVPEGRYRGRDYAIEPDASSASYPLGAAAIAGGTVSVPGLRRDSMQGDIRILDILQDMGCDLIEDDDSCVLTCRRTLVGIDLDMSDVSDLVPTVAAVAMFAASSTRIRNVGFIRGKESDRIGDLVAGIRLMGGSATEHPDGLEIEPHPNLPVDPVVAPTHHDHRLAMTWSLVALRRPGVTIDEPRVVDKSWPEWWQVREAIRTSGVH